MKKSFNLRNVLALSLTAAMFAGTAAFAQEADEKQSEEPVLISADTESEAAEGEEIVYGVKTGTVTGVEKREGYTSVAIDDGGMGLVLNADDSMFVMDSADGSLKSIGDLEEGMEITVVLSDRTPMTMSIPPIVTGATAVIIGSEGKNVDVLKFDNSLVSTDNFLQLNISEDTAISDIMGSRKMFTEADIKGATAIVVYGVTTRSIPAQTTPSNVIILESEEAEVVALREIAEKAGYSVKWTANNEPVLIVKDGVEIKALCDSNVIEKKDGNGVVTSTVLKEPVYLENSKMMVSSDFEAFLD